jgi:hypothetical protein
MNPRIQQLAKQARSSIPTGTLETEQWIEAYNDKLSELIIRECAAEADKQTIYCRGIPWGRWIKQHFGVEE